MSQLSHEEVEVPFPAVEPVAPGRHLQIGRRGEELARKYLWKEGLRILDANVRNEAGEIDIIGERKGRIHFIEVKTRSRDALGRPEERVDSQRRRRLRRAAAVYLSGFLESPKDGTQFDVVSVVLSDDRRKAETIDWLQSAF
jgi:putative endonuclease